CWLDARRRSRVTPRVPEEILQAMTINKSSAVILVLVSSLLLSSCADLKLPPNEPASGRYRRPGSGDCTFRRGPELDFGHEASGALDEPALSRDGDSGHFGPE